MPARNAMFRHSVSQRWIWRAHSITPARKRLDWAKCAAASRARQRGVSRPGRRERRRARRTSESFQSLRPDRPSFVIPLHDTAAHGAAAIAAAEHRVASSERGAQALFCWASMLRADPARGVVASAPGARRRRRYDLERSELRAPSSEAASRFPARCTSH